MGNIIAVLLVIGVAVVIILLLTLMRGSSRQRPEEQGLSLLQEQMHALRRELSDALSNNSLATTQQASDLTFQLNQRLAALDRAMRDNTGLTNTRLDSTLRVIREVSTTMGELSRATQQVYDVGRDIASLQQVLRAPKLRGMIGELFLGDLLSQVVPNHYELQYRFRSGETVDAVIKLGPKYVPVDAKFPLENFQRLISAPDAERRVWRKKFAGDVTKHVDAIAAKYIKQDEGTFDFALMYIPAENVYYETIIRMDAEDQDLSAYAVSKRVIPVSPNSLYAYLQAIVFGLRGLQIERQAQEIMSHFGRLQQDFSRFREDFDTVGGHLTNAHNKYEAATRHLDRLEEKLTVKWETADDKPESLPQK